MKNYKILETRPELTTEQIAQGMDFNKIKKNAALAKSAVLKSFIIKGLLGIVAISSFIIVYKNYKPSVVKKTQIVFADAPKTINRYEKDTLVNCAKTIIDKIPTSVVKHKTLINNIVADQPLVIDTNTIKFTSANNQTFKDSVKTSPNHNYPDDKKTENTNSIEQKTFGQADIKEINRSIIKINERLYASKFEVSNKLYMIFLNSVKQLNNANLLAVAEIDTLKWADKLSYNEPYVHYYHSHQAYQNFPVVNITYEGAKLFCEWLTAQYNSDPKRKFKKVFVRLPSEEEWIIAAQAGNSSAIYPWEGKEIRNKKGQIMCNFKSELKDTLWINGKHVTNADVTVPVNSYWKNNFGLYNMGGNVAEMLNEKGLTKGGSWRDNQKYLKIDINYKYDGNAQPFVGFRYFVEILEK